MFKPAQLGYIFYFSIFLFVSSFVVSNIVFTYDAHAQSPKGDVQIYRIGANGTIQTAPLLPNGGGQPPVGSDNGGVVRQDPSLRVNPYYIAGIDVGFRYPAVMDHPNIVEQWASCYYPIGGVECTVSDGSYAPVTSSYTYDIEGSIGTVHTNQQLEIRANQVLKVVFKYTNQLQSAAELIRVGSNGQTGSAPFFPVANNQREYPGAFVDTQTNVNGNPYFGAGSFNNKDESIFVNNLAPQNVVYGTKGIYGYILKAGYCSYNYDQNPCTVAENQFTLPLTVFTESGQTEPFYRVTAPTIGGKITRVAFKYILSNGDVDINIVDVNNTTISQPNLSVDINESNQYFQNGSFSFENVSSGTNTIRFSLNGQTLLSVKTCTVTRLVGTCNPTTNANVTTDGWWQYLSLVVQDGYVTVVKIALDTVTTVDTNSTIFIKRVGFDDTVSTVPIFDVEIDSGGVSQNYLQGQDGTNPQVHPNQTVGPHSVYIHNSSLYNESVGVCSYPIGGTECRVTTFTYPITCNLANDTVCKIDITTQENYVTKVVPKYVETGELGAIRIKLVGDDDTVSTSPETAYQLNTNPVYSSNNPILLNGLNPGQHILGARRNVNATLSAGTCTYPVGGTECTINNFPITPVCDTVSDMNIGFCSTGITVSSGLVTKVVFKYSLASQSVVGSATGRGDIQIKRVGSTETVASAPVYSVSGDVNFVPVKASVEGIEIPRYNSDVVTIPSLNPLSYADLLTGEYIVYSSNAETFTESVGTCSYARGGNECSVTSFPLTPVCSNVTEFGGGSQWDSGCFIKVTVTPGEVTKVVFKYTGGSSNTVSANAKARFYKYYNGVPHTDGGNGFRYSIGHLLRGESTDFTTDFTGLSPGFRSITADRGNSDYIAYAGYCIYSGASECTIPPQDFKEMLCGNSFHEWTSIGMQGTYRDYYTYMDNRCLSTAEFQNNKTTKIEIKYVDNKGDIVVYQVDNTNGNLLGPTFAKRNTIDTQSIYTLSTGDVPNPKTYSNIISGQHIVRFENQTPQAVVGSCQSPVGTATSSMCAVTAYPISASCIYSTSNSTYECSAPITVSAGKITKVQFQQSDYNYSVQMKYPSVKVTRGYETANRVYFATLSGTPAPITPSFTNLPVGVVVVAEQTNPTGICTPNCSIGAVIKTNQNGQTTPVGTYTIDVIAQPLGKATSFQLEVTTAIDASLKVCNMVTSGTAIQTSVTGAATGTGSTISRANTIDSAGLASGSPVPHNFEFTAHSVNTALIGGTNDANCTTISTQPYRRITYNNAVLNSGTTATIDGYYDQNGLYEDVDSLTDFATRNTDFTTYAGTKFNQDGEVVYTIGQNSSVIAYRTNVVVGDGAARIQVVGGSGQNSAPALSPTLREFNTTAYGSGIGVINIDPVSISTHTAAITLASTINTNDYLVTAGYCESDVGSIPSCYPTNFSATTRVNTKYTLANIPVNLNKRTDIYFKIIPSTLTCSVRASVQTVEIGKNVTWTVIPNPQSSSHTYVWSGNISGNPTTQSVIQQYVQSGLKEVDVEVTPNTGIPVTCSGSITVIDPQYREI